MNVTEFKLLIISAISLKTASWGFLVKTCELSDNPPMKKNVILT